VFGREFKDEKRENLSKKMVQLQNFHFFVKSIGSGGIHNEKKYLSASEAPLSCVELTRRPFKVCWFRYNDISDFVFPCSTSIAYL